MYIRDQIIQILTLARAEMRQAVDQTHAAQGIYPDWGLCEVLAHITGWDEVLIACLEAHAEGRFFNPPDFPETDLFNQKSLEDRRGLSLEAITEDWDSRRLQLISLLQRMPAERFNQPAVFPWGQVGTIEDVLRGFAAHERRHAGEIISNRNHN